MNEKLRNVISAMYKGGDGNPLILADGQLIIVETILKTIRAHVRDNVRGRVHIKTPTQYGKTESVSVAVLMAISLWPVRVAFIAPTEKRASIPQRYLIGHIFDNPATEEKFTAVEGGGAQRIRREKSKQRITLQHQNGTIGEVYVLSAGANKVGEDAGDQLMGFGGNVLVMDEAAQIPDSVEAKGMRMVGGFGGGVVIKIGNPWKRNHFFRAEHDPIYKKISVDYAQGIREGRYTQEFIDEMKGKPFFDVLYECEYPAEDIVDLRGFQQLVSEKTVETAIQRFEKWEADGKPILGVDIGRGGDFTVFCERCGKQARVLERLKTSDLMVTTQRLVAIMKAEKIQPEDVFIDDTGVGGGVTDRLSEMEYRVNGVKVGEAPVDLKRFLNKKAEMSWEMKKWLEGEGGLQSGIDWMQLCHLRYKEGTNSKLSMQPKQELLAQGIHSPDEADALMLTFAKRKGVQRVFSAKPMGF